jgi:hypothetical protein
VTDATLARLLATPSHRFPGRRTQAGPIQTEGR